jgi:hypothetical protein
MAKKKTGKKGMSTASETTLKSVRLDLTPEVHRLLRRVAAGADMSMASYARDTLERVLREEAKRMGIKD